MSRKSVVKEIQDSLEANSNFDSNSNLFHKQNRFSTKEKDPKGTLKKKQENVNNTNENASSSLEKTKFQNNAFNSKYGSVRNRINKINRQSTTEKSTYQNSNTSKDNHRNSGSTNFNTKVEPCESTSKSPLQSPGYLDPRKSNFFQMEKSKIKVNSIDLSVFEKVLDESQNKNFTLSSTLKIEGASNNTLMKPEIPTKRTSKTIQTASSVNLIKPSKTGSNRVSEILKNFDAYSSKSISKKIPPVPPRPRYINKIKPHPNLSSEIKQDLQAKIKIFNETVNNQKEITKPNKESILSKINNNFNTSSRNEVSSDSDSDTDDGYCILVKSDKKITRTESNFDSDSSDTDADEQLATEYDTIENLNITKITVEERYKVPNRDQQNSTFNVKRETYYDHNLNPRIEHITRNINKEENIPEYIEVIPVNKSALIIQELLQTEVTYFKGLLKVYEDYMLYFRDVSTLCPPNIEKVFGNFEEIYKGQFDFYSTLTECNYNVDCIAETFLKNVNLFNAYEVYIINKHIASRYSTGECLAAIQARDKDLGKDLNLESYLLTPVQRLLRYLMLLKLLQETLIKEKRQSTKLDIAVNFLDKLIEGTNIHANVVQRIQNSPIDFSRRGKYLMSEEFFIRNSKKKYHAVVILYEDAVIFTQKIDDETYIYKDCINLSDLYIRSITEDMTSFQLQNFTQYRIRPDNKYVFDLVSHPKIKSYWVKEIETLLWNQFAAHKKQT